MPSQFVLDPVVYTTISNPYSLIANTNQPFLLAVGGFQQLRIRLVSSITGAGEVTIFWNQLSKSPLESTGQISLAGTMQTSSLSEGTPGASVQPSKTVQVAGWDGTYLRALRTDSTGAIEIAGTIMADNPSASSTGVIVPTQATYIGGVNPSGYLTGLVIDSTGALKVTLPSGSVTVGNFPATQAVSGTVAVTQSSGSSLHVDVDNFPSSTTVSNFPSTQVISGTVSVSNIPATQSVSGTVAVSNFPSTQTVAGSVSVSNLPTIQSVEITDGTNILGTSAHPLKTDGSGVTQPISGTVAANAGTNLNTSALALENGGNLATIAGSVSSGKVQVNVTNSSIPVTGTFYQTTQPVSNAGTFAVQSAQSGTWNIGSITTLPSLPAGSSLIGAVNIEASGTALTTTGSSLNVNITGVSSSNPLPVVGSVAQFQPSVSGVTANTYAPLNTDVAGNLYVDLQNQDIFGAYVFQSRNPQFEVNHSSGLDTTLITPTVTGNGTATWAQGGVTLSTTANASSSYSLTSVQSLEYRVGFEWFSYFTVAFLNGSAPGSSQRIGLFNGSPTSPQDGFFIGYEGSVFGISQFQGGVGLLSFNSNVSPSIPITSFNTDQCNGTAGSAFTLNGTPVAINVNNINLFRLRGGWLGTGNRLKRPHNRENV